MKKILFVTRPIAPPWDEASKNFAYNLAKNLAFLSPSPSPSGRGVRGEEDFEIHLLTKNRLKEIPKNIIQHPIYTSSEKDFKFFQKLRSLIFLIFNARKFDIVHLFFTPTKFNSWVLKKILNFKHALPFNSPPKGRGEAVVQTIATLREDLFSDKEIKKTIFGDIVITYSDYAKNRLEKLGFKNIRRIYPGIDLDYYLPAHKNFRLLMKNNLRVEDFIVTYPGEYSRLGAIDDIVKAIKSLFDSPFSKGRKNSPPLCKRGIKGDLKFILACRVKNKKDARKKEKVIKKFKKHNLLDKVVFIDTVPDMAKLYNSSDVIIFPARDMKGKFDVPLAVIEAMACEKPVIISDIPILREFANDQNSVIIKSGDAEQLSEAILDLYQNKTKREAIGKTARKYAEDNFDIKKIASKYRGVYESL